jgi:hypothetical protein
LAFFCNSHTILIHLLLTSNFQWVYHLFYNLLVSISLWCGNYVFLCWLQVSRYHLVTTIWKYGLQVFLIDLIRNYIIRSNIIMIWIFVFLDGLSKSFFQNPIHYFHQWVEFFCLSFGILWLNSYSFKIYLRLCPSLCRVSSPKKM